MPSVKIIPIYLFFVLCTVKSKEYLLCMWYDKVRVRVQEMYVNLENMEPKKTSTVCVCVCVMWTSNTSINKRYNYSCSAWGKYPFCCVEPRLMHVQPNEPLFAGRLRSRSMQTAQDP